MNNGRVKKQYFKPRSNRPKYYLEADQRGFFCTCNFREKDCVKEAYNLLNEYANKLFGSEGKQEESAAADETASGGDGDVDISDQLKNELEHIKNESKKNVWEKRFQAVDTGAANCVFIRTNLPDPNEITTAIFDDLMKTKETKTRYLLRILPIMATCKTNMLDITEAAGKLFDQHFLKEASTFAIIFNRRYHSKLSRDDVIKELAELITMKNSGNKADLKHPKKSVIVEIIKGICLLSVVENFFEYRKYNMFELCKKEEEKESKKTEEEAEKKTQGEEVMEIVKGGSETNDEMAPNVEEVKESKNTEEAEKNAKGVEAMETVKGGSETDDQMAEKTPQEGNNVKEVKESKKTEEAENKPKVEEAMDTAKGGSETDDKMAEKDKTAQEGTNAEVSEGVNVDGSVDK